MVDAGGLVTSMDQHVFPLFNVFFAPEFMHQFNRIISNQTITLCYANYFQLMFKKKIYGRIQIASFFLCTHIHIREAVRILVSDSVQQLSGVC